MKKFNIIFLFGSAVLVLTSCGGFSDAGKVLRNEKTTTTDEFLVKKKEPLALPPDHSQIPEPNSLEKKSANEQNKINKIFKIQENNNSKQKKSSSIEKLIIDQINK